MDVLAKANAAVEAGADPYDVWKLLDGNPVQEQFGKQHIVKGGWVPAGAEFDEGEEQMVWPVLAALGSLFTAAPAAAGAAGAGAAAGGAGAAAGGAAGAGGAGGLASLGGAFAGLGGNGTGAMPMPPGQAGPPAPNTMPGSGWQGPQMTVGQGSVAGPAEDPWYKGLMAGDAPGGGAQSQSMSSINAPALHAVPAQQRRERQKSEFMLHPALRSLMGG